MHDLLEWAQAEYDRVIIDTPPAAIVADAVPLIKYVDRMLVVVRLRRTTHDAAEHLREQLTIVGAPVIGLVVNGAPPQSDDSYYRSSTVSDSFAAMHEKLTSDKQAGENAEQEKAAGEPEPPTEQASSSGRPASS